MAANPTASRLTDSTPTIECQCGAVSVPAPASKPSAIYHCHCIECRRQSASAFGTSAVFPAEPLFPLSKELEAQLTQYNRPRDTGGILACYFCKSCGSRLFHRAIEIDGKSQAVIFVKGGCVDGMDWTGGIHIFARSAVVPIPDGAERYDTMPPDDA
ncbi:Mss4-like protein [Microdochium trichocladiopsis]|uniref:Mss4-like protein n=1 Tax=Microdochium trichocladiopsis TaxID=1682393 RepID=A0A9P8Y4T0_9PEZI|nr:Mss4-like protein [Microdochium trichocladiopsis]KAH7029315.1 Mss4-like protein [Microdochium trichocladiopsis]